MRRVSVKDFFGLSLDELQQFTEFCTAIGKKAALLLVDASLNSTLGMIKMIIFLQSDAAAAIFFAACLVWLPLLSSYYSRAAFISLGNQPIVAMAE